MCHECGDEEQPEFIMDMIPEDEREEFMEFAS